MHSETDEERFCRVCGYEPADPPWGSDGQSPTYEVCPSCGVEYGYDDASRTAVIQYRERWLERGASWSDAGVHHDGLATDARLSRVDKSFK